MEIQKKLSDYSDLSAELDKFRLEYVVERAIAGKFINANLKKILSARLLAYALVRQNIARDIVGDITNLAINLKNMHLNLTYSARWTYIYAMNDGDHRYEHHDNSSQLGHRDNNQIRITVNIPQVGGRELTLMPNKIPLDQLYELCEIRGYEIAIDL